MIERQKHNLEYYRAFGMEFTKDDQGNDVILTILNEVVSYFMAKGCYLVNAETVKTDCHSYIRYWIMGDDLEEVAWSSLVIMKELNMYSFYMNCYSLVNFNRAVDNLNSQEERESWLKDHCYFPSVRDPIRFDKCRALAKADKESGHE